LATITAATRKKQGQLAQASKKLPPGHPKLVELRAEFATMRLSEYIESVLSEAPPLSAEQRSKLAELLRPVRQPTPDRKSVVEDRIAELDGGGDSE
jgi:hypothetical protein